MNCRGRTLRDKIYKRYDIPSGGLYAVCGEPIKGAAANANAASRQLLVAINLFIVAKRASIEKETPIIRIKSEVEENIVNPPERKIIKGVRTIFTKNKTTTNDLMTKLKKLAKPGRTLKAFSFDDLNDYVLNTLHFKSSVF